MVSIDAVLVVTRISKHTQELFLSVLMNAEFQNIRKSYFFTVLMNVREMLSKIGRLLPLTGRRGELNQMGRSACRMERETTSL